MWSGHVSAAPLDLVGVVITSDEDLDFGRRWYAQYRYMWPWVNDGDDGMEAHPAIAHLWAVYHQHTLSSSWAEVLIQRRHAAGLDGIWHSSAEWLCCVCGIDEYVGMSDSDQESDYDEESD